MAKRTYRGIKRSAASENLKAAALRLVSFVGKDAVQLPVHIKFSLAGLADVEERETHVAQFIAYPVRLRGETR